MKPAQLLACAIVLGAAIGQPRVAAASPERVDELIATATSLDSHPAQGGRVFARKCARCHGEHAEGNAERLIPALANQREAYLIKQLADFSQSDRYSTNMHRIIRHSDVNQPQLWADVAAWLNALPPTPHAEHGEGSKLSLGEAIYREQCSACHETDGRGDDDGFAPALRGQHYSYLVREIRGFGASHRRNVDEDLARFIDSLQDDEVMAVADYLSRLQGPTRERLKMHANGVVGD